MGAPQFTPGPWDTNVSRLSDGSILVAHIVADDGSAVAQLANHGEDRTLANGRLGAAAPELYEALVEIAKGAGPFNRDPLIHAENTIESMKEIAEAALAKVRGHCPGHVASDSDPKVCRHCGTHVDEYRDEPAECS